MTYYRERSTETRAFAHMLDTSLSGASLLSDRMSTKEEELSVPSRDPDRTIRTLVVKPKGRNEEKVLPAVIYFHGGGMASYSCFLNNFKTLGHLISQSMCGVVFMVDFRNSMNPCRSGDATAPFPGGLNDCVDAVRWISSNHKDLGIYKDLVLAGESGGGNLSIATAIATSEEKLVSGLYIMCPFISGQYAQEESKKKYPSLERNDGIVLSSLSMEAYARVYGDITKDDHRILAWPSSAPNYNMLRYLNSVHVRLNEFDPLLDEGKEFALKCLKSGLKNVSCSIDVGTVHGTGNFFPSLVPAVTRSIASEIGVMCRNLTGTSRSFY